MILNKTTNIQIKGIREGLLITLGEGEWVDIKIDLMEKIKEKENFFHGAKLAIDVGNRILSVTELSTLRDHLADLSVTLWAILSNSPLTELKAQDLGLATKISVPKPERIIKSIESSLPGEDAILLEKQFVLVLKLFPMDISSYLGTSILVAKLLLVEV